MKDQINGDVGLSFVTVKASERSETKNSEVRKKMKILDNRCACQLLGLKANIKIRLSSEDAYQTIMFAL